MDSKKVLEIFKEITRIPRESGHEEHITAWLLDWAEKRGLEHRRDAIGNVFIARNASEGKENVPTLVLQAHQDMVCEKNAGVEHDFSKDPVNYIIKDGWMIAPDTTLGADDGIGIAACLALLESDACTGRIECIFTISEETGMDGAEAMEEGFFSGKTLINLDSEDEGQMFIGCAGGVNTDAVFKYKKESVPAGMKFFRLIIGGAIGGHSGDDINKGRANTVRLMARFLYGSDLLLASISGGGKSNAIARECEAVVATDKPEALKSAFSAFADDIRNEYHTTDPAIFCRIEDVGPADHLVDASVSSKLISAMFGCPHGVEAMSQDIKDLVETSSNLAAVKMEDDCTIRVITSQRSSVSSACDMMAARVRSVFELAGAEVKHFSRYPGWAPDVNSHILKVCVESYEKLFGMKPKVLAIHAGLECGLFLTKFPGLDMISFGPTLRGVHAPGEKLELESMDKFTEHLLDVVTNFK